MPVHELDPKGGKLLADVRATPAKVYRDKGWSGMGDWLGTGTVAPKDGAYWPFKKARAYVHRLGLKSASEWFDCSKSERPPNIPSAPHQVYGDKGWKGNPHWLGYGGTDR